MKICVLGCGLRTPLLIHGLAHFGNHQIRVALEDGLLHLGATITEGEREELALTGVALLVGGEYDAVVDVTRVKAQVLAVLA